MEMSEIRQIKEVCLYVTDLDRTEKFYKSKLGFELISRKENRHVFFRVGNQVLLCFIPEVTKADTKLPPHFAYGKQHIAFEVSKEEYSAFKDRLLDNEIEITHEEHWREEIYSVYFNDPDENVLEVVAEGMWDY